MENQDQGLPLAEQAPIETPASAPEQPESSLDGLLSQAAARMAGETPAAPAPQASDEGQPATEAGEKPVDQAPSADPVIKVKIAGKEREIPQSELVKLAEMGGDYYRKTQELANQRKQVEGFNALIQRLQADPSFAQHVFSYGQQPQPSQQGDQPPSDPVERLKWEAVQEAKREIMREMAPLAKQQQAMTHQQQLQATMMQVRQDPMFAEVFQGIQDYVQAQPAAFRERIYRTLDQDPQAFLQTYGEIRSQVQAKGGRSQPQDAKPPVIRQETPREAPALESAGGQPPSQDDSRRNGELRTVYKRIKSNSGDVADIGRLLELSGAVARMSR